MRAAISSSSANTGRTNFRHIVRHGAWDRAVSAGALHLRRCAGCAHAARRSARSRTRADGGCGGETSPALRVPRRARHPLDPRGRRRLMSRNTAHLTGGEAIVRALVANGVDTVFGLPGAQMYPSSTDSFARRTRSGRSAHGMSRQPPTWRSAMRARTGRPGVCAVVPGPGVLNTLAALATAAGCARRCCASPARCRRRSWQRARSLA